MQHQLAPSALALLLSLGFGFGLGCNNSGSDGTGGGGNPGVPPPQLGPEDEPNVSPCPNQDILTDSDALAQFQLAFALGNFLYRDVPFDGGDPDIYLKKCGFEAFWDPADNVDLVAPLSTPVTLADLFEFGNAGICSKDFAGDFVNDLGFPDAGVYRKEYVVSYAGTNYLVRVRITVSGLTAGGTFQSLGLIVPDDIENTLGYEVNGVSRTHDQLLNAIAAGIEVPYPEVTLDILDMPGGSVLLTAVVEYLCIEIL